jgi:hypothetical protein
MTENVSDLALDDNAAGDRLQELFSREITSAQAECEACGRAAAVGSLRLYGGVMGAVLRCCDCDAIIMRAVHPAHSHWLEMRGARYLRFASE